MKSTIRFGVFETNSSSVHCLAIPKNCDILKSFSFHIGQFGWEFEEDNDPCDYFYTAIYEVSSTLEELNDRLTRFKNILNNNGISYSFDSATIKPSIYKVDGFYLDDGGYIDHGSELTEFVDNLLNDENRLLRFLSAGIVLTANDNSETEGFLDRDKEYIEQYDYVNGKLETKMVKNGYYMEDNDNYEWYWKGN